MRSANRERLRVPAPQRSDRMPFAGLSLEVSSPLRYVILAIEPLTMLAPAAVLVHKEKPAVIAVGCSPVLPFALRRISVIASALVRVMVLSVTLLAQHEARAYRCRSARPGHRRAGLNWLAPRSGHPTYG